MMQTVKNDVAMPQVQLPDKGVHMPVATERQIPMNETAQKTADPPHARSIDKVVNVTTAKQRRETGQKTLEAPQVRDQTVQVARVIQQEWVKPTKKASVRERVKQFVMDGGAKRTSTVEVPRAIPGERQKEDLERGVS